MFAVKVYGAVRRFVFVEGHSRREAARVFGLSRETVLKMCRFSLPPGYTRSKPVARPPLEAMVPVIDAILEADRAGPVKQRHTAATPSSRIMCGWRSRAAARRSCRCPILPGMPPGGFWRGHWDHRRCAPEDPFLLHGPAAI
jgi:hypothetical protein